jgi:hypothetical protein
MRIFLLYIIPGWIILNIGVIARNTDPDKKSLKNKLIIMNVLYIAIIIYQFILKK